MILPRSTPSLRNATVRKVRPRALSTNARRTGVRPWTVPSSSRRSAIWTNDSPSMSRCAGGTLRRSIRRSQNVGKGRRQAAPGHRVKMLAVVAGYEPEGWRGIDDLQYLGGCDLPSQGLIALGKGLIEPPLQLSVGTPKVDYFIIERRRHVLTRQPPALTEGY